MKIPFRYWLNKKIRASVMSVISLAKARSDERQLDFRQQRIKKILLVRGIFRMGDSILATPAIFLLRKNFPHARIDFVGSPISKILFQNLPINHHYQIYPGLPEACWAYWILLKQIRSVNYDLAIDVSGSMASMGAFIVGFSGARFRVGLQGRWDRWFNVRLPRPVAKNKYQNLPALVGAMGLEIQELFPLLILSAVEKKNGRRRVEATVGQDRGPTVGIFIGGRKTRGKRWPKENFLELITGLRTQGTKVIVFIGPEEIEMIGFFKQRLLRGISLVFEPSLRIFAAMVSNCDLFVACDSGPVHLACALRVRTVVIFLKNNFDRWGPPPSLGRVVYHRAGVSASEVLETCLLELSAFSSSGSKPSGAVYG